MRSPDSPFTLPSTMDDSYASFLARLKPYWTRAAQVRPRDAQRLAPVRALLQACGAQQRCLRVIHVAGTNGKGTLSAMLAELLAHSYAQPPHAEQASPVGLYTSPHLLDWNERIQLNGQPLAQDRLAALGHRVLDEANALQAERAFSFFDLFTVLALLAFAEAGARWVVLETGLGGRSDATNIVPKQLCVLTRIGLDHMNTLGGSLRRIAWEKLGIVPAGVPVVLGVQRPALGRWMAETLRAQGSPLRLAQQHVSVLRQRCPSWPEPWRESAAAALTAWTWWKEMHLDVLGFSPPAQKEPRRNRTAQESMAQESMAQHSIAQQSSARIRIARDEGEAPLRIVRAAVPRCRLERCHPAGLPPLVLDGAHNADALRALSKQLHIWAIHDYTLVLGMRANKLVSAIRGPLRVLLRGAERVLLAPSAGSYAADAETLGSFLQACVSRSPTAAGRTPALPRLDYTAGADFPMLLRELSAEAHRPAVICGSFHMLGALLAHLPPKTSGKPKKSRTPAESVAESAAGATASSAIDP